ncbi:MAG: hypothetical protein MZV63_37935 [Marinilabiliales bacterium]|nr:hypothetical protein [Marinilabiliales bacterium]
MKRLALLFIGIMLFPFFSHAGGIVTNTNQSAAWVRMFARDASTGIDAVYFNPAGLAKLRRWFIPFANRPDYYPKQVYLFRLSVFKYK